jgi:hypothetical protein
MMGTYNILRVHNLLDLLPVQKYTTTRNFNVLCKKTAEIVYAQLETRTGIFSKKSNWNSALELIGDGILFNDACGTSF